MQQSPLWKDGSDPERLLDLLVDEGNTDEAIGVYWHSIGNFTRLHHEGRHHLGAQLCRRLNDGLGPSEVSPALSASEGAWAVLNNWSQFALCCGDAKTSALAAAAAYDALSEEWPQWDATRLAAHVAEAHLVAGNLPVVMEWCERSWSHARAGMRSTGGLAVREVMEAYDWSANTIAKIYLRLHEPVEIRRLIDDLAALHEHARRSIDEFNASSSIPLDRPSGGVMPERLVDGRLAAMLALAEGRFDELGQFAAAHVGASAGRELHTLLLRAEISAKRAENADAVHTSLRDSAEQQDDCAAECELAVLAERLVDDPAERLALASAYLPRAEACGIGLHWRDLQLVRSRALKDLGRRDEARRVAEAALFGSATMAGAYPGDWAAAREASTLLQSVGGKVPDHVRVDIERSVPPERLSPRKAGARRPAPSSDRGAAARQDMHAAALKAIERHRNEGMPFVLYFRKFDFDVLHGPFELGPKLTENALRDALPSEVEVITIQDQGSLTYDLGPSRFHREAPALLLEDQHWAEVARALIPLADLIVSEPLMLSQGVRLELQMIYDAHRWDRTVLLLPPQHSPLETVDNDTLVQMFPRCIWADSLHREPFVDSPVLADLLERIRAIARLPLETRRALSDPWARDEAYPIDLMRVARYLENEVDGVFNKDDETFRYYAFWQMFRASAIRGVSYRRGDTSTSNRCRLARSYIEMCNIMLDYSTEGERIILHGDPAEAKLLVRSAYNLLQDEPDNLLVRSLRAQAEKKWDEVLKLEHVVTDTPLRFELRPRYGPLVLT